MSKKLYVYGICLAIAYVIFIGHSLYEGGQLFVSGFKEGWSQACAPSHVQTFICGGDLTPVNGSATFPSKLLNLKTGEEARFEITQVLANLSQIPDSIPAYVKAMDIIRLILSFVIIALFIYLPFVVYRIMKSISSQDFYGAVNIKRIRKASFILLGIFFVSLLANICLVAVTNAYMQIEGYKASLKEFNYSLLFIGLVILVLSEILRYTTDIKAEQDLTI
ncbi:MAG: DUF2975 domain-containing protein [Dysgonamonadaceae bacterium]|jgi:hypothetical protein|nr:DUF2975 domain-containing protein [Dysgonamonadaceae bacterium]